MIVVPAGTHRSSEAWYIYYIGLLCNREPDQGISFFMGVLNFYGPAVTVKVGGSDGKGY